MAKPILSERKAKGLSFALFLIGLAVIIYFKLFWPAMMLVIGLPLALRQYLLGKRYDMIVTLVVSVGVYLSVQFQIKWDILLPVLFTIGGIYIFFREFFSPSAKEKDEEIFDQEKEIEEKEDDKEK